MKIQIENRRVSLRFMKELIEMNITITKKNFQELKKNSTIDKNDSRIGDR